MKKLVMSLMMVALLGSFASAELVDGTWDAGMLRNVAAADTGSGTILNDPSVHTNGADWLSSLFYCELDAGSLYQNNVVPSMPWGHIVNDVDSWLAENVSIPAGTDANELAYLFSGDPANADVSICFIAALTSDPVPPWDGQAARFAFTTDAQGVWAFKVSAKGGDPVIYTGTIQDGVMMLVPEPGTIALLLCGLAGLFVLRRK